MIEGFTERAGYQVYHSAFGRGPAVLALHDGAESSLSLNHRKAATLVDWLWQHRHHVATFDRRGHGRSTPLDHFDTDFLRTSADDARAVLDDLGISEVVVIGVGDGAVVGLNLAVQHPDRVLAVVADSGAFRMTPAIARAARARHATADPRRRALLEEMHGADRVDPLLAAYTNFLDRLADVEPEPWAAAAGSVQCPVLFLASEPDPLGIARQSRDLAKQVPAGQSLIVSNPTLTAEPVLTLAPSTFRTAVRRFLSEHAAALVA